MESSKQNMPFTPPPALGAVVSDFHLLTNRSTAHHYLESLHVTVYEVDVVLLNGDIFDFQWSTHGGFAPSVQIAQEWLSELILPHPDTTFLILLGNHDSIPLYRELLQKLSDLHPRVFWYEDYVRLGTSLFLHGDALHTRNRQELDLYRAKFNQQLKKHPLLHSGYHMLARIGGLRAFTSTVSRRRCARQLLRYLRTEAPLPLDQVEDVYFGHVHMPFRDFEYKGFRFHNTGASLPFLRSETLRFTCSFRDIPSISPEEHFHVDH